MRLHLLVHVAFSAQAVLAKTFLNQAYATLRPRADPAQPEEDSYTCTATKGREIGCCGAFDAVTGKGVCGGGPDFCGASCISQCDWKSECDPGWGIQWSNSSVCPLNVCCSTFGFCGMSPGFCGGNLAPSPDCGSNSKTAEARTIGYYEGWNAQRPCGTMKPSEIPLGYYTHIFYSFALIHPETFHIAHMDAETSKHYYAVTELKARQPDLEVWIAVGGWAMNDPGPYRTTFSDLAKSTAAQDAFFESLIAFMALHDFDGVDIDWEYPVAEDRGGIPEDFENFPLMLARLRQRLNKTGRRYGISLTLPASYWYLRGFDIVGLEPHVDFFNVMTYDIHGTWDAKVAAIGPMAFAHTNMTEINQALELLWRNNINPARVHMGLGFYGRSFTMKNPSCMAAGCEFTEGARGGACTGTPGVLSAAEISQIIADGATMTLNEEAESSTSYTVDLLRDSPLPSALMSVPSSRSMAHTRVPPRQRRLAKSIFIWSVTASSQLTHWSMSHVTICTTAFRPADKMDL